MCDDLIQEKIKEINQKLYGPRHCNHCDKVQPVHTYVLAGSQKNTVEGQTLNVSFTGSYACAVCMNVVGTKPKCVEHEPREVTGWEQDRGPYTDYECKKCGAKLKPTKWEEV